MNARPARWSVARRPEGALARWSRHPISTPSQQRRPRPSGTDPGPWSSTRCGDALLRSRASSAWLTNLAGYSGCLDILAQLRPVTFDWKSDGTHDLGFVAEDVAAIDPLLATYRDGVVEGVKYDRISTVLVTSVMEQQAQIDALPSGVTPADRSELDALRADISALQASDSGAVPGWLALLAAAVIGGLAFPAARSSPASFDNGRKACRGVASPPSSPQG